MDRIAKFLAVLTLKQSALSLAGDVGVFTFCRWLTANQVRVLAYHGVDERHEPLLNFDGFHVHPELFERHLRTLRGHYRVVALRDLVECFRGGRKPPRRSVAITFDDGYRNNLAYAAKLLGEFCMPATFFVTTGFIDETHRTWWFELRDAVKRTLSAELPMDRSLGKDNIPLHYIGQRKLAIVGLERELKSLRSEDREARLRAIYSALNIEPSKELPYPMMTWDDINELQSRGHEIGAHTVSHISLAHESDATVGDEVRLSIARIAEKTGRTPVLYSYPYGEAHHSSSAIAKIVQEAGCIGGVTTIEGFNRDDTHPFLLKRVNVTGNHDRNAFRALVSGLTLALRK